MAARTVAILACRIIALVLGVRAATAIASYLLTVRHFEGSGPFWAYVGPTAVAAFFLWVMAEQLSAGMTRGVDSEGRPASHSMKDLYLIALSIVGVIMVVEAVPHLAGALATDIPTFFSEPVPLSGGPFVGRGAAVATQLVKIAIGLGLIFGSGEIARRLSARHPEPAPPPDAP